MRKHLHFPKKELPMIDVDSKNVEQFVLEQEKYTLTGTFTWEDMITSKAVPGFQFKVKAIFDRKENLTVL